jgi:energy-coupling factor transporter transmembrane protein EcfT
MAELTFVRYQPGTSVIHRLDVRIKLFALILLAISAARADLGDLAIMGILVACGFLVARPQIKNFSGGLLWWLGFVGLVFASRALTSAGPPVFGFGLFTISHEGLQAGARVAGRLAIIGLMGLLLVVSTRPMELKAGIHWLLRPIPGLPAGRVATMLGLVLRFIPMIFEQAGKTSAALKARAIEQRRNPFYRIKYFALPLTRRLFEDTDNLILAMQARQYSDRRTDPILAMQPTDWIVGICLVFLSIWIMR